MMNFIDDLIFFLLHEMVNEYKAFKGVDHCFFWENLGRFLEILGRFSESLGRFSEIFGRFLGIFRTIFGHISDDFWVIFCRF